MKRPLLDDRTKAKLDAGLLKKIDAIFIVVALLTVLVSAAWGIFGTPTFERAMIVAVALLAWIQIWIVFLVLRTAVFVLEARAAVETLPADAAQLVRAYAYNITPQPPMPGGGTPRPTVPRPTVGTPGGAG